MSVLKAVSFDSKILFPYGNLAFEMFCGKEYRLESAQLLGVTNSALVYLTLALTRALKHT